MGISFKVVDVPVVPGGKVSGPNPFEPAAEAAVKAQEQGKAIAFDLDLTGFKDITTTKTVDGEDTTTTKTATDQASAYAIRKIRELGVKHDRTFTVLFTPNEGDKPGGTVTVSAKARITREKKPVPAQVAEPATNAAPEA